MNLDMLGWSGTLFILSGVYEITQHKKKGFSYSVVGNILLGIQGIMLGMTNLVILNIVLLCLNISGFRNWSKMGL